MRLKPTDKLNFIRRNTPLQLIFVLCGYGMILSLISKVQPLVATTSSALLVTRTPSNHQSIHRAVRSLSRTSIIFPRGILPSSGVSPVSSQQTYNHRTFSSIAMMTPTDTSSSLSSPNSMEYPIAMTEDERYLFDLNGYLIIRGVLSPEQVKEANDAIDRHQHEMIQRSEGALRNAIKGTTLYGTGPGRKDLGGVLEWDYADSKIFKTILAHPRLVPLFHGILGKGYRLDHIPFVIAQDIGAEGFQLHGGTVDCVSGEYNPHLAYTCHHGFIRSALLACNVVLTDHNAGYGGFCIVPGSHKSNFKMPKGMVDGDAYSEFIVQPVTKAGDVVLFSEGTVHGAMPWTQSFQRRVCLYRFSPATNVYGRSYFGHGSNNGWPVRMYEHLTEAERAVLEPPYANRLDRPEIQPDGSTIINSRNAKKKQHDQNLFKTKYF